MGKCLARLDVLVARSGALVARLDVLVARSGALVARLDVLVAILSVLDAILSVLDAILGVLGAILNVLGASLNERGAPFAPWGVIFCRYFTISSIYALSALSSRQSLLSARVIVCGICFSLFYNIADSGNGERGAGNSLANSTQSPDPIIHNAEVPAAETSRKSIFEFFLAETAKLRRVRQAVSFNFAAFAHLGRFARDSSGK